MNWPAVAVNVPVANPAGMVRAGDALMLPVVVSATVAPPVPAALLRVTVQVVAAPGANEEGLQVTELGITGALFMVIVPPVATMETALPSGVAPRAPVNPMLAGLEPETVADTVATEPFPITLAFIPLAMQIYPLEFAAQVTVLPAAVRAAPAATETFETLAG